MPQSSKVRHLLANTGLDKKQNLSSAFGQLPLQFSLPGAVFNKPKLQSTVEHAMKTSSHARPSGKWPLKFAGRRESLLTPDYRTRLFSLSSPGILSSENVSLENVLWFQNMDIHTASYANIPKARTSPGADGLDRRLSDGETRYTLPYTRLK